MLRRTAPNMLQRTTPKQGGYTRNDPRYFINLVRPFNIRESTYGYNAHSCVQWMDDFQAQQAMWTKSQVTKFFRAYYIIWIFWSIAWAEYFVHMGHKTPGCPWSSKYDPSRQRSF
eukprot:TRINITY_DN87_c1_g1_i1.p1 TRINITY_DN87_c1_g1~~TRINITY_DN87_c1_g1_i1.p1  ORF type:complete len:115 (+),score=6.31 TRINITY_DN87_c1_g1_i1:55-399(+)